LDEEVECKKGGIPPVVIALVNSDLHALDCFLRDIPGYEELTGKERRSMREEIMFIQYRTV